MRTPYSVLLTLILSPALLGAQTPVGIFTTQSDVGRAKGSASYDPRQQAYSVAGSGHNMWDTRDAFHFVWKRIGGNFILSTRARFIGRGVEEHRKIGWTIRPSLDTSSAHVSAALHGNGLMSLQFRRQTGAITEEAVSRDSLPDADAVIQLERRDGAYIMSVAQFGDTLVTQQLTGVALPDTVYVGLFVCAHNDTVTERATFTNVRITTPAKRDFVPYTDYIGSNLEILDVATGNATIVHSYRGSFQAPNWTHDGKALIYAQEGRLHRFDLSSGTATAINTGFATANNNDHVLSFDGRMMGISHHAVEDSGASIVYTLPASGGTPRRVTAKGPSYLHGWSPDGRWLVYVGERNDSLDIYKISAAGGEEIRLTTAPGLDDGPEYTPDGTYIYFNSSRSGRMQIWRMRPDGSAQEQVTNDGFNNWFPHISPDGKWIVYLAFGTDVAPDDHPFYKHVSLRLMPIGGGPARVIAYLYGGQGTINVPSWAPDGKRLAFVSNTHSSSIASTLGVTVATSPSPARMARAATQFLESLRPEQRQQATFAFSDSERTHWHFIPTELFKRKGLTLGEMTAAQQQLARELLSAGLSQRGYLTATQIMELEAILGALEAERRAAQPPGDTTPQPPRFVRDPLRYFFSVFGTPSTHNTWGWRVEGHHLSMHFTVVDGTLVAGAPTFLGSNPAEVRSGPKQGTRILAAEEDAARALLESLDSAQRATAIINTTAPNDIVTVASVRIDPLSPVGIAASALTTSQRALLKHLVDVYAGLMADDIAADRLARIEQAGWDHVAFAWAGSLERGQKHYYRVQGPTFLIEYDNTQNDGNHIHSVWRDFHGDFGADLLREHVHGTPHND